MECYLNPVSIVLIMSFTLCSFAHLRGGVTTVDPQLSTSHVCRGIREKEDNSAHQVLGTSHLSLRDEGCPLTVEVRVAVDDLLCAVNVSVRETCHEQYAITHSAVNM